VCVVFATFYAASDEWHQSFVPSRTASLADVTIDSVGAICGALWFSVRRRTLPAKQDQQYLAKKLDKPRPNREDKK
jgi:VanZ family protein